MQVKAPVVGNREMRGMKREMFILASLTTPGHPAADASQNAMR
jgi:hypothetical protein